MLDDILTPVSDQIRELAENLDQFSIGSKIRFDHDFVKGSIVLFGIKETRGGEEEFNDEIDFQNFRKNFYELKLGNWHLPIFDIGDLHAGEFREDTYVGVQEILKELLKKGCLVILVGGSLNLAYAQYRSYDTIKHNLVVTSIDNKFRLGNDTEKLSSQNYLSKIITIPPHNLFEYTNLGHQTYFVGQEELDLMEQLNFEVKRLGKLVENIKESEPELRNSDMIILNLESVQISDFQSTVKNSPNGFNSREICSLSRYAGINNKVSTFGVYNFKAKNIPTDELLLAEIIWYFIEGKNFAPKELNLDDSDSYEKYYVQTTEQDLIFYHDPITEQWWLELEGMNDSEEFGRQIIPCSPNDYKISLGGKVPDRWWKSYKKLY